jgi:hypothetical protein
VNPLLVIWLFPFTLIESAGAEHLATLIVSKFP